MYIFKNIEFMVILDKGFREQFKKVLKNTTSSGVLLDTVTINSLSYKKSDILQYMSFIISFKSNIANLIANFGLLFLVCSTPLDRLFNITNKDIPLTFDILSSVFIFVVFVALSLLSIVLIVIVASVIMLGLNKSDIEEIKEFYIKEMEHTECQ